ncbi:hypothetical protein vBSscSF1_37 [Staphylococcus phage vB-SscS-F1]|nr:hypothetical protein vBApySJF1_37 [Arcanobacterium phage vB-ApyS-JF1]
MDGNRIYLVSEEIDYEGSLDVHICKSLEEVIVLFEKFNIIKKEDGVYCTDGEKNFGFDYLDVKYRDLDKTDTVARGFEDNILELKEKIVLNNHQQSALGAVLSAKVGLNNIKSYEVVHDKNFMITDINISLNTRNQAIINNTHREVSQHFAANLYGIEINITKPVK